MARTDATTVKALTGSTVADSTVTTYIGIANRFVTDKLAAAGLSTDQLTDIEAMITAHLLTMLDRGVGQLTEYQIGDTRAAYGGTYGMSLDHTSWGQQAKVIDTSGTLQRLDRAKATFGVYGPAPT